MSTLNTYGALSPRTAAYAVVDLLERGMPFLVFEKYGQAKPLPRRSSKTIKFRRYYLSMNSTAFSPFAYFQTDAQNNFSPAEKTLTEGVTPDATKLESTDYNATLVQFGDRTTITDVIMDTHEDDVLREAIAVLGEQAAIILETARFNILKAGTNVVYANGSARTDVNTVISLNDIRNAVRTLKRQLAKPITSVVKSTPAYGTEPVAPAYIAVCHPDVEPDLRAISGFVPAEKYGAVTPWENEIGKIEHIRFMATTICEPWLGGGAADTTDTVLETSAVSDVYPILIFGRDAYGLVPLKGENSVTPMVVNPTPSDSDPMAQRGHVSWKAYSATIILNDFWMNRIEVAVSTLS